jgi:hypothetical protein
MSINQSGSHHTQKGNIMNPFGFVVWLTYTLTTALWLGDNGWTPIVGIPWIIIVWGFFAYVLRQDFLNRKR